MLKTLTLSVLLMLGASNAALAQSEGKEQIAMLRVDSWLSIVDNEGYAASWEEASHAFKVALPKSDWIRLIAATRGPLGKKLDRIPLGIKYTTELPGAPDGEYVVVQFKTSFEYKSKAVETLTVKLDKDGSWRVAGYYIR